MLTVVCNRWFEMEVVLKCCICKNLLYDTKILTCKRHCLCEKCVNEGCHGKLRCPSTLVRNFLAERHVAEIKQVVVPVVEQNQTEVPVVEQNHVEGSIEIQSYSQPKKVLLCPVRGCGNLERTYKYLRGHIRHRHSVSILEIGEHQCIIININPEKPKTMFKKIIHYCGQHYFIVAGNINIGERKGYVKAAILSAKMAVQFKLQVNKKTNSSIVVPFRDFNTAPKVQVTLKDCSDRKLKILLSRK